MESLSYLFRIDTPFYLNIHAFPPRRTDVLGFDGSFSVVCMFPFVRRIKELDRMDDPHVETPPANADGDLQGAARVAGRHDMRSGSLDVGYFPFKQPLAHILLHDIVHTGTAAADMALFQGDEPESGNLGQQLPRLGEDTLPVQQVAGVVVCDGRGQRSRRFQGTLG